ncbi:MAG TPA: hypothetical protein VH744_13075 [Terriglobales bacterium]
MTAWADEGHHHEELTPEQLGTVHFPVSCSPSVQQGFERGVALLHSFSYEAAEKAFQRIADDDAQCAMAHWGVAMSIWHQLWNQPDAATLQKGRDAVKKAQALDPKTERERRYIAAVSAFYTKSGSYKKRASAYVKAMEQIHQRFPDDHEAAAFYALSVIAVDYDDDHSTRKKTAIAVLEKLFAEEPNHPGVAHYLIHSYDSPDMAHLGVPAARRYAKIAPAAPHALHMPSHIFARLGLWQDDIDSNLASIAATRKSSAMHMGDEGHQFHAIDFLVYAYLQSGREAEARRVIDEVKAMPKMTDMYGIGFDPHVAAMVALEASYVLELHLWNEAASLPPVPDAELEDSAITCRARAIGLARTAKVAEARKELAQLEAIHKSLLQKKKKDIAEAVDIDRRQALAWVKRAEGKDEEALKLLRAIADKDEGASGASDGIPAREMLADMLLELKRPAEALAEYDAELKANPNRFNALYGAAQAAELSGKAEKGNAYYSTLVEICTGSSSDRPELKHARSLLAKK